VGKLQTKIESSYRQANKVLWQTVRRLHSKIGYLIEIQQKPKWCLTWHPWQLERLQYFKDILNSVALMPSGTQGALG